MCDLFISLSSCQARNGSMASTKIGESLTSEIGLNDVGDWEQQKAARKKYKFLQKSRTEVDVQDMRQGWTSHQRLLPCRKGMHHMWQEQPHRISMPPQNNTTSTTTAHHSEENDRNGRGEQMSMLWKAGACEEGLQKQGHSMQHMWETGHFASLCRQGNNGSKTEAPKTYAEAAAASMALQAAVRVWKCADVGCSQWMLSEKVSSARPATYPG